MKQTPESVPAKAIGKSSRPRAWQFRQGAKGFSRAHTFAVEIGFAVIAPIFAGWWLDSKTGTSPWLTIAGLVLGGGAAIRSTQRFYAESQQIAENGDESSEAEESE